MNIIRKLTLRHILTHKKRTILTLMSIIVSVAMVTAVLISVLSFMDFMKEGTIAYDGNWHIQLQYDSYPNYEAIEKISKLGKFYISDEETYFLLEGSSNESNESAFDYASEELQEIRSINIIRGKFPKNSSEVLINEDYIKNNNLNWNVGQQISLKLFDYDKNDYQKRTFTISGIAKGNVSYFDYRSAVSLLEKSSRQSTYFITLSLDKLDSNVFKTGENLCNETKAEGVTYNTDLIRFSGVIQDNEMLTALAILASILILIIIVSSVFMIYDSFAVSYRERQKYLGMLSSVGASARQRNKSIYFEGFIIGIVAIPLGIISGIIGMTITFHAISDDVLEVMALPMYGLLKVQINPLIIALIVLASAITIFISCLIPAKRASKYGIIDTIRENDVIKVNNSKKLKSSKLSSKIFGFEGSLASKNAKRNIKRSRSIVFALCLSLVMFLTVGNLSSLLAQAVKNEIGEAGADVSFSVLQKDYDKFKSYLQSRTDLKEFSAHSINYAYIEDKSIFGKEIQNEINKQAQQAAEEGYDFDPVFDVSPILINSIDDDEFRSYLKQIGQKEDEYFKENQIAAVAYNRAFIFENDKRTLIEPFVQVNGKSVELQIENPFSEDDEIAFIKQKIKICKTSNVEAKQKGIYTSGNPVLIVPLSAMKDINANNYVDVDIYADEYESVRDEIKEYLDGQNMEYSITDYGSSVHAFNAILNIFKVFIYGFISLIALIAAINIINSISTSMNERKREFAMFKSIGMNHSSLKKMIYVENFRYALKSILISFPISALLHYLMYVYLVRSEGLAMEFTPYPLHYVFSAAGIIAIIIISLLFSIDKLKNRSIIEGVRQE